MQVRGIPNEKWAATSHGGLSGLGLAQDSSAALVSESASILGPLGPPSC